MDIIEKTFTSTLDFIKEIQTFKEKFVYRGHSDESYRLVPTFCRLKNNKNSNALFDKPPNWVSEEGLLIDNFKKSALPNLKIIPTNFLEWITNKTSRLDTKSFNSFIFRSRKSIRF